jgi:hypothetical protein
MNLTRREALRGSSAAMVAIAASGAVVGAAVPAMIDEPLIALVEEFRHAERLWIEAENVEHRDPEVAGDMSARSNELLDRLYATPAYTYRGLWAKVKSHYSDEEIEDLLGEGRLYFDGFDQDLSESITRDIARLAGEAAS